MEFYFSLALKTQKKQRLECFFREKNNLTKHPTGCRAHTGGGSQDVQHAVVLLQGILEDIGEELEGDILEGQGGP